MIIDCHSHCTTAPSQLGDYREHQKAGLEKDPIHELINGSWTSADSSLDVKDW